MTKTDETCEKMWQNSQTFKKSYRKWQTNVKQTQTSKKTHKLA